MRAKRFLSVGAMALFLAGWGGMAMADEHPSNPETIVFGRVECGSESTDLCVDIYRVTCKTSVTVHASVTDEGDLDDVLSVTVVGLAPNKVAGTQVQGTGTQQLTSVGGSTPDFAEVNSPKPTTLKALVMISNTSSGGTNYDSNMHCHAKDSSTKDPANIVQTQDQ